MPHIDITALELGDSDLPTPSAELISAAAGLTLEGRPFIDGRYFDSVRGRKMEKVTPISGKVFSEFVLSDIDDVDRAVQAARSASDDGRWSGASPIHRKKTLLAFADLIEQHADELALIDAIDMGKPFDAARSVDINSCLAALRWNAELIDKVYGEVAPTSALDVILREPLGVVAVIVPWNYPLMLAAWKFSAALAAGNSVILKPSEFSPFSALKLGGLAAEAGIPDGVFNVLGGTGDEVGAALAKHPGVNCISFTGSTRVGKLLLGYAGATNLKHVSLECGGKNPCIVADDADLTAAADKIASATFYNAGQSCNAPGRILVHASRAQELVERLCDHVSAYTPTHPLLHGAKVGSIVNRARIDSIEAMVSDGVKEGVNVVVGGARLHELSGGFYYSPTVITNVTPDMVLAREEIFGPVVTIEEFDDLDAAIVSANALSFGLWAGIWTKSLPTALNCIRRLQAGTVAVNNTFGGDITTPFGGYKDSGVGRDRSVHGFLKYTQLKHININP